MYRTTNFDSEGHKSISDKNDLQLIDSYFDQSCYRDACDPPFSISGHIKNNAGKTFKSVGIKINYYNSGSLLGSTSTKVSNLEPGGVWTFKAIIMQGASIGATSYKITEIMGCR
jgi:hypothetical protein